MLCKIGNGLPCVRRVDVKQKLRHVQHLRFIVQFQKAVSLFWPVAPTVLRAAAVKDHGRDGLGRENEDFRLAR
jgi:hypothetical protein